MFTDIDTCLLPSCRVAREREQEVPALREDVASLKEGREKEASALREEVASLKEKVALYLGHSQEKRSGNLSEFKLLTKWFL